MAYLRCKSYRKGCPGTITIDAIKRIVNLYTYILFNLILIKFKFKFEKSTQWKTTTIVKI